MVAAIYARKSTEQTGVANEAVGVAQIGHASGAVPARDLPFGVASPPGCDPFTVGGRVGQ